MKLVQVDDNIEPALAAVHRLRLPQSNFMCPLPWRFKGCVEAAQVPVNSAAAHRYFRRPKRRRSSDRGIWRVFKPPRATLDNGATLNAAQLGRILKEVVHPDNRLICQSRLPIVH
jgi:hypothetical protein